MLRPVLLSSLFSLFCPVNNLFVRCFRNYLFIRLFIFCALIGNTRCSSCSEKNCIQSSLAPSSLPLSILALAPPYIYTHIARKPLISANNQHHMTRHIPNYLSLSLSASFSLPNTNTMLLSHTCTLSRSNFHKTNHFKASTWLEEVASSRLPFLHTHTHTPLLIFIRLTF